VCCCTGPHADVGNPARASKNVQVATSLCHNQQDRNKMKAHKYVKLSNGAVRDNRERREKAQQRLSALSAPILYRAIDCKLIRLVSPIPTIPALRPMVIRRP